MWEAEGWPRQNLFGDTKESLPVVTNETSTALVCLKAEKGPLIGTLALGAHLLICDV